LNIATDEWEVGSWKNDRPPTQKNTKKYNSKDKINHKNAVYMDAGSTKVRIGSFLTADKESV
jgi:hypothetical protein